MVVRASLLGLERDAPGGAVIAVLGGLPLTVSRTKWEASEMELTAGDPVVVGLRDYRLLPHYPLSSEAGSRVVG